MNITGVILGFCLGGTLGTLFCIRQLRLLIDRVDKLEALTFPATPYFDSIPTEAAVKEWTE